MAEKRFTVTLTRTTVETATITVAAPNRVQAAFRAAKEPQVEWTAAEPQETVDVADVVEAPDAG